MPSSNWPFIPDLVPGCPMTRGHVASRWPPCRPNTEEVGTPKNQQLGRPKKTQSTANQMPRIR
eukprot:11205437-Lingulodinium_polyedra.AAC.1